MTEGFSLLLDRVFFATDLSCLQKLIYTQIISLSRKNGYCWATSAYFANALGSHRVTVSKAIKDLVAKKYLRIEIEDKYHRKIYVNKDKKSNMCSERLHIDDKCVASGYRGVAKSDTMCSERLQYIDNNITNNIKNISFKKTEEGVDNSPLRKPSSAMEQALSSMKELLDSHVPKIVVT